MNVEKNLGEFSNQRARILDLIRYSISQGNSELIDRVFQQIRTLHSYIYSNFQLSEKSNKKEIATRLIEKYFGLYSALLEFLRKNENPEVHSRLILSLNDVLSDVFYHRKELIDIYFPRLKEQLILISFYGNPSRNDNYFLLIDKFGRIGISEGRIEVLTFIRESIEVYTSTYRRDVSVDVLQAFIKNAVMRDQDYSSYGFNEYGNPIDILDSLNQKASFDSFSWKEKIEFIGYQTLRENSSNSNDGLQEYYIKTINFISRKIIVLYIMALEIYWRKRTDFLFEIEYTRPKYNEGVLLNENPIISRNSTVLELISNLAFIEDLVFPIYIHENVEPNFYIRLAVLHHLNYANPSIGEYLEFYRKFEDKRKETFLSIIQLLIGTVNQVNESHFQTLSKTLLEVEIKIKAEIMETISAGFKDFQFDKKRVNEQVRRIIKDGSFFKIFQTNLRSYSGQKNFLPTMLFGIDNFNIWRDRIDTVIFQSLNRRFIIDFKNSLIGLVTRTIQLTELKKLLKERDFSSFICIDVIADRELYFEFYTMLNELMEPEIDQITLKIGKIDKKPVYSIQSGNPSTAIVVFLKEGASYLNSIKFDSQVEHNGSTELKISTSQSFTIDPKYTVYKVTT